MSILSQIGVVVLIAFIILILIRSNKTLEEVSKEGEHFVDEWESGNPAEAIRTEMVQENRNDKIISMHAYKNAGITLIQLNEQHHPVRRVKVDHLPFYIGRSTKNQLVLDDLCVARMHCRIVEKDGVFLLQDVGSANKLYANGRVEDQVILRDKLTVYIGNVEFQVEMGTARSSQTQLYQNAGEYYYE